MSETIPIKKIDNNIKFTPVLKKKTKNENPIIIKNTTHRRKLDFSNVDTNWDTNWKSYLFKQIILILLCFLLMILIYLLHL